MFTGIVKESGRVVKAAPSAGGLRLGVAAALSHKDAAVGDSISVNGVCLTVAERSKDALYFDAVAETLEKTTLGSLKSGDTVNVEPALRAGDKIGGHFVLGHIDCVGNVRKASKEGAGIALSIEAGKETAPLLVEKGSVAVDGVSLTACDVKDTRFTVHIIPHTLAATTLGRKKAGDAVNVEFDVLGKYILRSGGKIAGGVTDKFLMENGFI